MSSLSVLLRFESGHGCINLDCFLFSLVYFRHWFVHHFSNNRHLLFVEHLGLSLLNYQNLEDLLFPNFWVVNGYDMYF